MGIGRIEKKRLEKELIKKRARLKEIKDEIVLAEHEADWDKLEELHKEKDMLLSSSKHILYRLGRYEYKEGESVEFEPGQFMDADQYYWLLDE